MRYKILKQSHVNVVNVLNGVHKQKLHPGTIDGEPDFYLPDIVLMHEETPQDFKDYLSGLNTKEINKPLNLINWDNFKLPRKFRAVFVENIDDLPMDLFHYTSADGLLGILSSNNIWATHYSFLNDYNEFNYAKGLLREFLPNFKNQNDIPVKNSIINAWDRFFDESFKEYNIFITSFSEVGDSLSQWRGYSENGQGYALGFKTCNIGLCCPPSHGPERRTYFITKVIYERSNQLSILNDVLNNVLNDMNFHVEMEVTKLRKWKRPVRISEIEAKVFYRLLHSAAFKWLLAFKAEGFSEEHEWRAIQSQNDSLPISTNPEIKFRSNGKEIIPYVELDLSPEVGDIDHKDKLPLSKIIYGPRLNKQMAEKSLHELLRKYRYTSTSVEIVSSKLTLK